jgi:uncharacterized membrane protein
MTAGGAYGANRRINIIDALRGISIILMVIHHLLYDLVEFMGAPEWLFSNPVFDVLQLFFAGLFIFLSGVSSRFSRGNVRRGLITLAAAAVVTLVTWAVKMPVVFGILHFLSFCMLFYGLARRLIERLGGDGGPAPVVYAVLFVCSALVVNRVYIGGGYLWAFGWHDSSFLSYDYFPIFPWLFLFLIGTWAGGRIARGEAPLWFYGARLPLFAAVGRRTLIIYLLHQPVIYGAVMILARLTERGA